MAKERDDQKGDQEWGDQCSVKSGRERITDLVAEPVEAQLEQMRRMAHPASAECGTIQ